MGENYQHDDFEDKYVVTFVADVANKSLIEELKEEDYEWFPLEGQVVGFGSFRLATEPDDEVLEELREKLIEINNQNEDSDMYYANISYINVKKISPDY